MVFNVNQREEIFKLFFQCKIHPIILDHTRLNILLTAHWMAGLNSTGTELPSPEIMWKVACFRTVAFSFKVRINVGDGFSKIFYVYHGELS